MKIAVIGGGVIGVSTACELAARECEVLIIDPDPTGDRASNGNAGGVAVTEVAPIGSPALLWKAPAWLLDPLGPAALRPAHAVALIPWLMRMAAASRPPEVERIASALSGLLQGATGDLEALFAKAGMRDLIRRTGALTVYESERGFAGDAEEWSLKRRYGIVADPVSADEAREIEPQLGPLVVRAIHTPQWSMVTDPLEVMDGLRRYARQLGVNVISGAVGRIIPESSAVRLEGEAFDPLRVDHVVIAAGAWSGHLARSLGDRVALESERGYNLTVAEPSFQLKGQLIFGERKFVASSLSTGLRIGGAAEFGGLKAKPDFRRAWRLGTLAQRYLPNLELTAARPWAGHRPSTPDSLPVIGRSAVDGRVYYAFGHGHLGLTLSATTARIVAQDVTSAGRDAAAPSLAISRF